MCRGHDRTATHVAQTQGSLWKTGANIHATVPEFCLSFRSVGYHCSTVPLTPTLSSLMPPRCSLSVVVHGCCAWRNISMKCFRDDAARRAQRLFHGVRILGLQPSPPPPRPSKDAERRMSCTTCGGLHARSKLRTPQHTGSPACRGASPPLP